MKTNDAPDHIAVQFRHLLKQTQSHGYSIAAVFAFDHDAASSNELVWFVDDGDDVATKKASLCAAKAALQHLSRIAVEKRGEAVSCPVQECCRPATCIAVEAAAAEHPGLFAGVLLWGDHSADNLISDVLHACSSVISSFFVARFGDSVGHQVEWLGISAEFRRLLKKITTIGPCDSVPVLISGERGSGKEAVAMALHYYSKRRHKSFLSVNCAALTEHLYVSELFGCCKGAYTGADHDRKGKFALANGGTLFLDEITEVPAALTAALLRALDRGEIQPLGASKTARVDVRVIAATNRDIDSLVAEGKFPADVFDRLAALRIRVPPLRNRREDIGMLAAYYAQRFCPNKEHASCCMDSDACFPGTSQCVTDPALKVLCDYSWPGNVRELRNIIVQSITGSPGPIAPTAIPEHISHRPLSSAALEIPRTLIEATKRHIESTLRTTGGNKSAAARMLGLPLSTLVSKIKKLGIDANTIPA